MTVDIRLKRVPAYKVASILRVGSYKSNMLRSEFSQLVKWANQRKLRTGKWMLYFIDEPGGARPMNKLRSEACLQIKGNAESEGKIKVKTLPAQNVASVTFNPDKVSPHLVYSGIYGWLRYSGFKDTTQGREVYNGNPWRNPRAWANAEVQVPAKKKKK
ncbi:MAG: GyrI-like domain-containing protein [Candidatus Bathyarchaeia archaeon]